MTPGIELHVPADLRNLYEVYEYRHAAALLYDVLDRSKHE